MIEVALRLVEKMDLEYYIVNYSKENDHTGIKNLINLKFNKFNLISLFLTDLCKLSFYFKLGFQFKFLNYSVLKLIKYFYYIYFFKAYNLVSEEFFTRTKPDVVFFYGDRNLGAEPHILKLCKEYDVPGIILPIAFYSDTERLLKGFRVSENGRKKHLVDPKSNFYKRYPNQCLFNSKTKEYFSFYPDYITLCLDELSILPARPNVVGGGNSSYVCIENKRASESLISNGVDSNKIIISGSLNLEDIYISFKNKMIVKEKLIKKYAINEDKIVIISLPQLMEHGLATSEKHWEVQNSLCSIQDLECKVFLSLHPKMKLSNYINLREKYDVTILEEPLRKILPIADLYIVGQGSSTIEWSRYCKIPTIIADWYGLDYTLYKNCPTLKIIKHVSYYRKSVQSSLVNKTYKFKPVDDSHLDSEVTLSKIGKFTENLTKIISSLC